MLASFVAVLVASFAVMRLFSALRPDVVRLAGVDACAALLPGELAQQLVLAGIAAAGVAVSVPDALRLRAGEGVRDGKRGSLVGPSARALVAGVAAIGLIGGLLSVGLGVGATGDGSVQGIAFCLDGVSAQIGVVAQGLPGSLVVCMGFALLCLLTGIYEEAFLRVLGTGLFERAFRDRGFSGPGALLAAAFTTSVLFALLHAGAPAQDAGTAGWVQAALRFVQTFSFGMCMAALFARSGRLAPCALAHTGFNLLYLGASFTLEPTYGSGAPSETVLLAVTATLLAGVALWAWAHSAARRSAR